MLNERVFFLIMNRCEQSITSPLSTHEFNDSLGIKSSKMVSRIDLLSLSLSDLVGHISLTVGLSAKSFFSSYKLILGSLSVKVSVLSHRSKFGIIFLTSCLILSKFFISQGFYICTSLSSKIRESKTNGISFNLRWQILKRAKPYINR